MYHCEYYVQHLDCSLRPNQRWLSFWLDQRTTTRGTDTINCHIHLLPFVTDPSIYLESSTAFLPQGNNKSFVLVRIIFTMWLNKQWDSPCRATLTQSYYSVYTWRAGLLYSISSAGKYLDDRQQVCVLCFIDPETRVLKDIIFTKGDQIVCSGNDDGATTTNISYHLHLLLIVHSTNPSFHFDSTERHTCIILRMSNHFFRDWWWCDWTNSGAATLSVTRDHKYSLSGLDI